jgi:hypothetical protein
MNPHRCAVITAVLLFCASTASVVCWGQAAESIPAEARTSPDPTPFEAQIKAFVEAQAQKLANADDPDGQSEAREALVKAVDDADATPAYLDMYARTLNPVLVEMAKNENMRVRLNAAIVTARVAEKANNNRLAEAASAFVKDKTTAVAMWGVRAAEAIMPALMRDQVGAQNPLPAEVIAALGEHPIAPIVEDAYDALSLGLFTNPNATPPGLKAVVPHMLDLLDYRVQIYAQQIPEQPIAEQKAGLFFQKRVVWQQTMDDEQRARAMQLLSDLLTLSSQHTDKASQSEKDQLARMISQIGQSISVIGGDYLQSNALSGAGDRIVPITPQTPAPEIRQRVQYLYPVLKQINEFSKIQPAPPIVPPKPAADAADAAGPEAGVEKPKEPPATPATTGSSQQ